MSSIPVREMIKNAVEDLGGKASYKQIIEWITTKYGDVNHNTVKTQTMACSVNRTSRIHLPECGKPRGFDSRYDFLYQTESGQVELYEPAKHGNWEIKEHDGKTRIAHNGKIISSSDEDEFYFVAKDFESFTGIKEDHANLFSRFKILESILKKNLGDSFKDSNSKVGMYWERGKENAYKNFQWLGFDRKNTSWYGIFQVSLNSPDNLSMMIWIDSSSKKEFKRSISEKIKGNQEKFIELLKTLPPFYYVGIQKKDEKPNEIQVVDGISSEFIETIKNNFEKNDYHFYIARKCSKNEAIQLETKIVDEICNTFDTLVPISDFLAEEKHEYFILRHNADSPWDDVEGNRYHFGKTVPNQKKLRDAGGGTKTIWFTKQDGEYYFWGYGTVKKIETVQENEEWNLIYDNFTFFEKQDDSLELDGKFLKRGSESVKQQIQSVDNFNNQHAMTQITKKIYEDITGDKTIMSSIGEQIKKDEKSDLESYIEALEWKPNLILYGPPGTGKTFHANEIANKIISDQESKIAICWPTDKDESKVEDFARVIEENGKVLWGVNWSIDQVNPSDFPIVGYVYYKQNIIAIAKISNCTSHEETEESDLKLRPQKWHNGQDYKNYLHFTNIHRCKPFSHKKLKLNDPSKQIPDIIQQRVYVKQLSNFLRKVTFHPSYSYEDFVEGFRPNVNDSGKQPYVLEDGIFKLICQSAKNDPDNVYVLLIDEINRGNIPKILGELITLIEEDKRKEQYALTLAYSKEDFFVPANLRIIATMNTADKSLMQMDDALKRRFVFEELMPDTTALLEHLKKEKVANAEDYKKILDRINEKILGKGEDDSEQKMKQFRDRQIGHSYFWKIKNDENLQSVIKYDVIPLLQDYFYGDYNEIRKILGDEIISEDNRLTNLVTDKSKANDLKIELLKI